MQVIRNVALLNLSLPLMIEVARSLAITNIFVKVLALPKDALLETSASLKATDFSEIGVLLDVTACCSPTAGFYPHVILENCVGCRNCCHFKASAILDLLLVLATSVTLEVAVNFKTEASLATFALRVWALLRVPRGTSFWSQLHIQVWLHTLKWKQHLILQTIGKLKNDYFLQTLLFLVFYACV